MRHSRYGIATVLLVLTLLMLVGCATTAEPTATLTAIPLPTKSPTEVAEVANTPLPTDTPAPTAMDTEEPTAAVASTAGAPSPSPTPTEAATEEPPSPTPTPTTPPPTATPTPRPTKPPDATQEEATAPTALPQATEVEIIAPPTTGTGPDDALMVPGDWQELKPEESLWYAFQYKGDGSKIRVQMEVEPAEGAYFVVWTPEEIERWRLGLEAESIGRGAPDPSVQGNLLWTGSFTTEGTYYVVVEHSGEQPGTSYYLLQVSGDGVSLAPPAPPAAAKPKPTRAQPKAEPPPPSGKLVFQTFVGGYFYTIKADGSGLQRITDGFDPTWSPDGQQIAFARWHEPRGIWIVDADGSNEWRTFDWYQARWPSWSPDGERVLFSRQHGGRTDAVERCFWRWCFTIPPHAHWKLAIVRLADEALTEPPGSDFSQAPHWSPDGGRIVFDDEQGLSVQTEDGAVSYLITHDPRDTSPVWSPDGDQVAYTRRQHDHWEIYVVNDDGRNQRRLTNTPKKPNGEVGHSASPTWSPDGHYIAFLSDRTGKWEIWIMRADGSQQRPMFETALDGLTLEYGSIGERAISWSE